MKLNFQKPDICRLRQNIKQIPKDEGMDAGQKWVAFKTEFMKEQGLYSP